MSEEGQRKREMKLVVASSVINDVFNTSGTGRRRRRKGTLVAVMRHPDMVVHDDVEGAAQVQVGWRFVLNVDT